MEVLKFSANLIVTIFLFIFNLEMGYCQKYKKTDISFLIGLMNDYGGKVNLPNHSREKYLITDFYSGQSKAKDSFVSKIEKSGLGLDNFEIIKGKGENPITFIYSEKYGSVFNNYYKFKKADFKVYVDESDDVDYDLLIGEIDVFKFKEKQHMMQFLKGAFIRNGKIDEERRFMYRFGNSVSKDKTVLDFLKKIGIEILDYKVSKNTIPIIQTIYFQPSDEFEKFLLE